MSGEWSRGGKAGVGGMGVGIAIGVAIGVALGNIGVGIAIGVAIGAGVGWSRANRSSQPPRKRDNG